MNAHTADERVGHAAATGGWNSLTMDLWMVSLDGLDDPQPVANEPYPVLELGGTFSDDGSWFAYTVGDGPAIEYAIWARPSPFTPERRRVSQESGVLPLWSAGGEELFYRPITRGTDFNQFLRGIRVSTAPSFSIGVEEPVSIGNFLSFSFRRSFDVMPDGETFLVVLPAEDPDSNDEARAPQVRAILNWTEELKERVPVP